ncbi:universal stress protein [Halomonas sp. ANAO-440]|uniref:universal stress protein n=1 Tax=Halomonas sp. ANAO-440 TaxID=2861360 RepID=UPI001CAA475D|nr:universal stress protein [Halomonas sp. ANAO-440]MBZ0332258.1 universal stress protein [Halomonas sp. ANAO-440]
MQVLHVAVDESRRSLQGIHLGELLHRQWGGTMALVSVVASSDQVDKRRAALHDALDRQELGAYRESLEIVTGDAADVLAGLASDPGEGLLCMTSHGRRPASELLLGSVAAETVRRAGALVVLGGPRFDPGRQGRIDTLMVCVDGSRPAESVLEPAVNLARRLDARLQLLHVVEVETDAASVLPGGTGHGDIMESGYVQSLARRIREADGFEVEWEVLHGDSPAEAIHRYLTPCTNAMVVMTTHGRSGFSQVATGSVSREILHKAHCPVGIMRPVKGG